MLSVNDPLNKKGNASEFNLMRKIMLLRDVDTWTI